MLFAEGPLGTSPSFVEMLASPILRQIAQLADEAYAAGPEAYAQFLTACDFVQATHANRPAHDVQHRVPNDKIGMEPAKKSDVSIAKAARISGYSRSTLGRWMKAGKIEAHHRSNGSNPTLSEAEAEALRLRRERAKEPLLTPVKKEPQPK